jgi:hypothetical protein
MIHKELLIITNVDEGVELRIFNPKNNSWNTLIAFDIESLDLQAHVIYDVDILEVLN